jgi:hypothetical protein
MKIDSLITSFQTEEARTFIREHEADDVRELSLKKISIRDLPVSALAQQINGRQKARIKLPLWYKNPDIVYPPGLSVEQSSSEATAFFKARLLRRLVGKTIERGADLTGGLGVDARSFSLECKHLDYVEPDEQLLAYAEHNLQALGSGNITYHLQTAEDFLRSSSHKYDFIFIDPSRRKQGQKVYRLSDSVPNVVEHHALILEKTNVAMVKVSPLLDIQQGVRELTKVSDVFVVAVANECKELLFVLRASKEETKIHAVDLDRNGRTVSSDDFSISEEKRSLVEFSPPLSYIYEPNAAILKAGAFRWTGATYALKKLAINTHMYTSDNLVEFPGRVFQIMDHVKLGKQLKDHFDNGMANIISRNHPLTVEEIKKKTGLKEGGGEYLICTQDSNHKYAFIAKRL